MKADEQKEAEGRVLEKARRRYSQLLSASNALTDTAKKYLSLCVSAFDEAEAELEDEKARRQKERTELTSKANAEKEKLTFEVGS